MRLFRLCPALLASALLLTGCAGGASSTGVGSVTPLETVEDDTSAAATQEMAVYRGQIGAVSDESVEVHQTLPGFDYGYDSVLFHLPADLPMLPDGASLQEGAYIEVYYSGVLSRSDPPQGTAEQIELISTISDDILLNGRILTASATDEGYRLIVQVFTPSEAAAGRSSISSMLAVYGEDGRDPDTVILNVPALALEGGLGRDSLVEGAEICAVTKGIAALSSPPQYPVHALLPFSRGG